MSLSFWLRLWKSTLARSPRTPRSRRRRRTEVRPSVETLETRTVPATLSPLVAKLPIGSLLYESSGSGQVTSASPADSVNLTLDGSQTLSVAVDAGLTLYGSFNGHSYALTTPGLNWVQAEAEAISYGGHLVAINSQEEQDWLTNTFLPSPTDRNIYWIGMTDENVEGTWVWSNGDPVSYTNWYPNEPNNSGNENYAVMNWHYATGGTNRGAWNDVGLNGTSVPVNAGIMELPSASLLQPVVTVSYIPASGPPIELASGTAAACGGSVVLQNIAVADTGTYTVQVEGANGTTGGYRLRVAANGVFEAESFGGDANYDRTTAENLDPNLSPLGSGRYVAVSASLPANTGTLLATDDFENTTTLGSAWTTYSSLSTGRIRLIGNYGTASGEQALLMDDMKARGSQGLNEAVWKVNLEEQSQAILSFAHANWNDEVTGFNGSFIGHANADGIAISADGTKWYPIWTPPAQAVGIWQSYTLDLAALAAQKGISLGNGFQIKFQQYGSEPLQNDGRGWDNLRILVPDPTSPANQDWYSFTLAANEAATLTVTPQGNGAAHLQIYGAAGGKLYDGDPAPTNVGEAVTFTASAAGTYYARVSGTDFYSTRGVDYTLTVTAGAAFDLEDNSGPQPWAGGHFQTLAAGQASLGTVLADPASVFVSSGSGGLLASERIVFHNGDLFVVSRDNNTICRYDGTTGAPKPSEGNTGALFASGNGLSSPVGIDFDPDGNLYIANYTTSTVVKFDGSTGAGLGTFVSASSGGLNGATGLVFGPDGNLYVSSRDSDQVMRYSGTTGAALPSAGNSGAVFAQGGGLDGPDGLIFGPDSRLYVSSQFNNQVIRYDAKTGGSPQAFVSTGSGGLVQPLDLRFGPDGDLYVTSFGTGQVLRYQGLGGASPGTFRDVSISRQSGLSDPTGLTFGPDGALYVTSRSQSSVLRMSGHSDFYKITLNSGDLLTAQTATPFDGPLMPLNTLDPVLRFYDAEGNLLAPDDNGMSDLRNARFWYQSDAGGDYYIEVASADDTTGEYLLKTAVYQNSPPLLRVDNTVLAEGDTGTTNAVFTVTLYNPPESGDVTVDYATEDGTALAGDDYTTTRGTLTFTAGEPTTQTITVPVTGDQFEEADEYFFVQLSNATGAPIAFDAKAKATVRDDDTCLSLGAITVVEGDVGTLNAVFPVTLLSPTAETVTVTYSTADGTARVADGDYVAASGTLTFEPGETCKTITVAIPGDTIAEARSKTFYLNLTAVTGVESYDNQAVATLLDNDYSGTLSINYANFNSTSGLQMVGSASTTALKKNGAKVLRLTPATANQTGGAWFTTQQDVQDGFKTTFQFQMSGGSDGFAFVIQNAALGTNALGKAGGGIGYDGIENSVAVEFDTWLNAASDFGSGVMADPNDNHVSIQTGGTGLNSSNTANSRGYAIPPFTLDNNVTHKVTIDYVPNPSGVGGTMRVFLDDAAAPLLTVSIDLAATLALGEGGRAWVGFTAATGGGNYQKHDILNWSFAPLPAALAAAGGAVTASPSTDLLSAAALQPLVQEALHRWEAAGLTAAQDAALHDFTVQMAELGGSYLGLASAPGTSALALPSMRVHDHSAEAGADPLALDRYFAALAEADNFALALMLAAERRR